VNAITNVLVNFAAKVIAQKHPIVKISKILSRSKVLPTYKKSIPKQNLNRLAPMSMKVSGQ